MRDFFTLFGVLIELVQGDLFLEESDVIVNLNDGYLSNENDIANKLRSFAGFAFSNDCINIKIDR